MELIRIDLTNFRSFRESRVELQDFTVLVGENECGKSNILRAIELLDRDVSWEGHVRFALDDEGVVDKGSVRFVFSFSEDDYDAIESNISALIFCNNEYVFGALRGKDVTLSEYIRDHIKEGVFTVNIKDGKRWGSSWTLKAAEFVPADHIFSVATGCPQDFLIDGVQVAKYKFFSAESNISSEYLKPVDVKSLYSNLYTAIGRYTSDNLPRVVYWKYAEGQLFPDEILISEFVEDNDICVPLKNIFIAAGVQEDEISSEIERRLGGHRNDLRNYLRYVSSRATEQLRRVWLDSDVSLELTLDGVNILCGIRDKYNSFGVGQRSEGFKRVLSFLLQISAVAPNRIKGEYVVLIDEPDACLHPSAIRSLRDELVRLSSVYKVVAATHSIFMIDRGNIDRHIIVKKENEITTVQRPSNSNFFSEEVLYNALTYSMFSVLKERNFILEGWYDYCLFESAMNKKTKKYSKIIKQISSDVGACYAGGCKNFTCVAPILKLAKRDFVLISDADETAKDCQNKFLMGHHHGTWVRYDEILRGDYFITAEDFVSDDCLKRALLKTKVDEDLRQELNSVVGNGDLIANLKRILLKKYKQHSAKDILSAFKKSVYKEVSCDDIREEYFEFLKGVMNRFE